MRGEGGSNEYGASGCGGNGYSSSGGGVMNAGRGAVVERVAAKRREKSSPTRVGEDKSLKHSNKINRTCNKR